MVNNIAQNIDPKNIVDSIIITKKKLEENKENISYDNNSHN
jgi:hypothetical protein